MKDDELARHYADPANRRLAGRPKRRAASSPQTLSNHVPIRFSPSTMATVQAYAHSDGMTVSAWIRSVVDKELERRIPTQTTTTLSARAVMQEYLPSNQPNTHAVEPELRLVS